MKKNGIYSIEAVVGIILLVMVGLLGSRMLLNSARSVAQLGKTRKALALAEMVFEQYNSYAVTSYPTLADFDAAGATPQQFFNKSDNLGFDGMTLTTVTLYSTAKSTCTLTVTVAWQEGGQAKSQTFSKTYTASTSLASGGAVQVWVKIPCSGYTSQADIIANCPGLPGFSVSAPAATGGSNTVQSVTDNRGAALLRNVAVGDSIAVQVAAPAPSDYNVPPSSAGFVQAYYAILDENGTPTLSQAANAPVDPTQLTTVLVTSFKPAGQVTGTLVNNSDAGVVGGVRLSITGFLISAGQYQWFEGPVWTDAQGRYGFYNVKVPVRWGYPAGLGNWGTTGSSPNVQPGSADFSWGYTDPNSRYYSWDSEKPYAIYDLNSTMWTYPPAPGIPSVTLDPPLSVTRRGWLAIKTVKQTDGAPLGNVSIPLVQTYGEWKVWSGALSTDANGMLNVYNYVPSNSSAFNFSAATVPVPVWHGKQTWTCQGNCLGVANPITIPMSNTFTFTGRLVDLSGIPIQQAQAGSPSTVMAGGTWGQTQGDGKFSLSQFTPESFNVTDPTQPFPMWLVLRGGAPDIQATLGGQIFDSQAAPNTPAPHADMDFYSSPNQSVISDANGRFNVSGSFPYLAAPHFQAVCDQAALTCSPVNDPLQADTGQGLALLATFGPWFMDSLTPSDGDPAVDAFLRGAIYNEPVFAAPIQNGQTVNNMVGTALLGAYQVGGTVRDAGSGQPLGGVQVGCNSQSISPLGPQPSVAPSGGYYNPATGEWVEGTGTPWVTAGDGSYLVSCPVSNRSNTNPGHVVVYIPPNQVVNGATYQGTSSSSYPAPPSSADPWAALNQDFALQKVAGAGGM